MAFLLFILVNLVLFIRPSELMPELATIPIYYIVIVAALIAALPSLVQRLSPASLISQPATVCVLGLLPAIVLSYPLDLVMWSARNVAPEFLKVILYFLLILAVIDTEYRLKMFLLGLVVLITASASLSLSHHYDIIHLPALEAFEQTERHADGTVVAYPRLRSTGIFNDPNDFAMILIVGIVAALYLLGDRNWSIVRVVWLGPLVICGMALFLTKSRGGVLALFAAMVVLAHARWGWKRAALAGGLAFPVVVAIFAMRSDGGMESGTGQARVQLWAEGLMLLRSYPIFGIGHGTYAEEFGHVAHNSFVNSYVELGLVGGTLFFGANAAAAWALYRIRRDPALVDSLESRRLLAAVTAILFGTVASQFSLSRAYVNTPYLAIGLAVAFASVVPLYRPFELPRFNPRFLVHLSAASAMFFVAIQVFVRFAARWS